MTAASRHPTVLIAGIGEVGRYLVEFLARDPEDLEILAGDLDLGRVRGQVDNASFGAALHHRHSTIEALEIDLLDIDRTAELLAERQPDVVVNCAVLQTWHVIRRLPVDLYERVSSAGLGAWLPVQLTLAMRLAQAIERSRIQTHYVNTSLSDLTNPVMGAMGIAPTIGIGNVALIEAAIRSEVAARLGLFRTEVAIKLVAHHVHWVLWREAGYREGAPFYLKIDASGEDVTARFDSLALMKDAILRYPSGTAFSAVSASSALHNLKALLSPEPVHTHSPGPNGLPGGYPVILSRDGAAVDLPEGLELDTAIAMNLEAQTFDGIARVDDDARVHFMPYAVEIMRDTVGFECESFTPDEAWPLAREQMERFRALERRHRTA